ncbi:MAG: serine protease, partial [Firmicutes bacterium]|nr:serine protease [Bacillota bacterium]
MKTIKKKILFLTGIFTVVVMISLFFALVGQSIQVYALSTNIEYDYSLFDYFEEEKYYIENTDYMEPFATGSSLAHGGDLIVNLESLFRLGTGTITINAVCNRYGDFGVITNEHVSLNRVNYHESTGTNNRIGRANRGYNDGNIDASFIPFERQDRWGITPNVRYVNTMFTNVRMPRPGFGFGIGCPVIKIGQTNGITRGSVRDMAGRYLFEITNPSYYGDSGGPIFLCGTRFNSDYIYLIGILTNMSNHGGFANHFDRVMERLNITPITLDNYHIFRYGQFDNIGNDYIELTGFSSGTQLSG